ILLQKLPSRTLRRRAPRMVLCPKRFDDGFQPGAGLDGVRARPRRIRAALSQSENREARVHALVHVLAFRRRDHAGCHSIPLPRPSVPNGAPDRALHAAILTSLAYPRAQNTAKVAQAGWSSTLSSTLSLTLSSTVGKNRLDRQSAGQKWMTKC